MPGHGHINGMKLYLRYVSISIRSQLQHRASFVMMLLGSLLTTGIEFAGIAALFARFGTLRGWSLPEVGVFYGVINIAFALSEGFARGFDTFPAMVKSGDFDRLLLRPRSLCLQVAAGEVQLMRSGRLLQGGVVLWWSLSNLHLVLTRLGSALLAVAVVTAAVVFTALFIAQAALAFWTVESLEIMNTVTYGGTETAQYPLTIYRPWFRRFFTFVIPIAFANYLPINLLLHHSAPLSAFAVLCAAPIAAALFASAAMIAWSAGVRHYHSTGS